MPDSTIVTAPVPKTAKVINARAEFDRIANLYPTDIGIAAGIGETTRALIDAVSGMTTKRQREKLQGDTTRGDEDRLSADGGGTAQASSPARLGQRAALLGTPVF